MGSRIRSALICVSYGAVAAGAIPLAVNQWTDLHARQRARAAMETALAQADAAVSAEDHALALLTLEEALRGPRDDRLASARATAITDAVLNGVIPQQPEERLRWHHALASAIVRESGATPALEVAAARVERARGQKVRALQRLRALVVQVPDDAHAALALAESLADEGEVDEALTLARRSFELSPSSGRARWVLGEMLLRQGKSSEALPHLSTAAQAMPDDPRVHHSLGLAFAAAQDWVRAQAAFERAAGLDPTRAETRHQLGDAHARNNRPRAAAEAYQAAWNLARDLDAYRKLGRVAVQSGDREVATQVFGELLERDQDDPEAHFVLGLLAEASGRVDTARAHFEACVAIGGRMPSRAAYAGRCHAALAALDTRARSGHRQRMR